MKHYLIQMIFYTAGVVGFLLIAYIIAKRCMNGTVCFNRKKGNLEIEETLSISPRKTLHIVKAFDEKFLIASDATSTTLLAKLNSHGEIPEEYSGDFSSLIEEKSEANIPAQKVLQNETSVIKSMLKKLSKE